LNSLAEIVEPESDADLSGVRMWRFGNSLKSTTHVEFDHTHRSVSNFQPNATNLFSILSHDSTTVIWSYSPSGGKTFH